MWEGIFNLLWTFAALLLSFFAGLLSAIYVMEKHIISLRDKREQDKREQDKREQDTKEHLSSLREQEKKEEKCVPLADAERLWRMLDDINSLDKYCRGDDKNFRREALERASLRLEVATSTGFMEPLIWKKPEDK